MGGGTIVKFGFEVALFFARLLHKEAQSGIT